MRRIPLILAVFLTSALCSRAEDATQPKPELEIPEPEAMVPGSVPLQQDAPITDVAWSPDGMRLAACDEEGNIVIWQAWGGGKVRAWKDEKLGSRSILRTIAWSPDGALIVTSGDERVTLWDAATGEVKRTIACLQPVASLAFLPASSMLVIAGSEGALKLADLSGTADPVDLPSPSGRIEKIAVSPDGKALAVAGQTPQVAVIRLPDGELLSQFGAEATTPASWVAWGPGKHSVFTRQGNMFVQELDPTSGIQTDGFTVGLYDPVVAGQSVPDGEFLIGVTPTGSVFCRALKSHETQWSLDLLKSIHRYVAVSPDGRRVAVPDGSDSLVIIGVASGNILAGGKMMERPRRVAWSCDGSTVFATRGSSEVHAFDSRSGWRLRGYLAPGNRVLGLVARDDGALIAATYGGAWLRVTDLTNSHDALRVPCKEPPAWSSLSHDGRTFAWRTPEDGVHVWDLLGGAELLAHPPDPPSNEGFDSLSPRGDILLSLSPRGDILRGHVHPRALVFFDTSTGLIVQKSDIQPGVFGGASLSPDGALTVFWSGYYFEIATTGRAYALPIDVSAFTGPGPWIACAFSPDSRLFAILFQRCLTVFDPVSRECVACFPFAGTGAAFAWSPDGSRLATLNKDGITDIWAMPDCKRSSQPRSDLNNDWGDLACLRIDRALRAAARLEAAGPEAVAVLRGEFAGKESAAHLEDLLKQMGDPDQARHDAAVEELTWLGVQAEPAIAAEMARVEPGAYRDKLEGLLRQAESRFGPSAHNLQRIRGMEVLEGMASAESMDVLRHIGSESPSPRERADADAAIRRIEQKNAR